MNIEIIAEVIAWILVTFMMCYFAYGMWKITPKKINGKFKE